MPAHASQVPFPAHAGLLRFFISHRPRIVERIQDVLNAQQQGQLDLTSLSRLFEDSFYLLPGVLPEQAALRGQLQQAHWDEGFRPRVMPGIPNEMFDPADMISRATSIWHQTRWPGRNARLRYAHSLFNLYLVRCVTLLDMRLCDAGPEDAGERVALLQALLDELWESSPPDLPVLVRDVRWLVPIAQSPATDDLACYFRAAARMEQCLPEADRLEIHKASLVMAGGHLRSQLRYFTMQGKSLTDHDIILETRASNALDYSMLIQHMVPLLSAYEQSIHTGATGQRHILAGIICQGLSADPELYVNRLDLLGPYSMIEHHFISTAGDEATLTPMGQRHLRLVEQYATLIRRMVQPLLDDCQQLRPVSGKYSPYGVMFGYSSNILEHMTIKTLQPDAETGFSLEDVFTDHGEGERRLAWISGWRRLAHVPQDVLKRYEYPQAFAEEIFGRIEAALRASVDGSHLPLASGRLLVDHPRVAALPASHVLSSDPQLVAAGVAQSRDSDRLLADRLEGVHLVSYQSPGGWVAISKNVLTDIIGSGQDANLTGLPGSSVAALKLLYPGLVSRYGAPAAIP